MSIVAHELVEICVYAPLVIIVVDSLYLAGRPRAAISERIGPDVVHKRVVDLRPQLPGVVVVQPRYFKIGEVLLRLLKAAELGKSGVVRTANMVFESPARITDLHVAVDVYEISLHFFRTTLTVSGTRTNRMHRDTLYFGQRGGPSELAVYDKLREANARIRRSTDPDALTELKRLRHINRSRRHWIRVERRYKSSRLPVRRLDQLDRLAHIKPFDCVRFLSLNARDPGRFTGNDFLLAHGIQRCVEVGLSQSEMRAKFGANFYRFRANHSHLFEEITLPDLQGLYQESIIKWLRR